MSTKSNWYSKWWITSVILPIIASVIADKFKNVPIWTTLLLVVNWIKTSFLNVINFEIKVWYILVFIFAAIFVLYVVSLRKSDNIIRLNSEPSFSKYKRGRLKRWLWSWEYELNYSGKYEIVNMLPICESCDIKMIFTDNRLYSYYRCPKCNRQTDSSNWESTEDIQALIIDNIEKKQFNVN